MSATEPIAARARLMSEAGYFDESSDEVVPSPCISVCRMTPDRSHCEGCFRTLDEIRVWSRADAPQRRAIWAQLLQRAVQVGRGLDVHGDPVGAGLAELLHVALGLDDHQVHVDRQPGRRAHGPHDQRADGDVGHEAAVHHVQVQPRRGTAIHQAHGAFQVARVGVVAAVIPNL